MNQLLRLLHAVSSRPHATSSQLEGVCRAIQIVVQNHEGLCDLSAALETRRVKKTAPRGAEFASKAHKAEVLRLLLSLLALDSRALESVNREPEFASVIAASRATALQAVTLYLRKLNVTTLW